MRPVRSLSTGPGAQEYNFREFGRKITGHGHGYTIIIGVKTLFAFLYTKFAFISSLFSVHSLHVVGLTKKILSWQLGVKCWIHRE